MGWQWQPSEAPVHVYCQVLWEHKDRVDYTRTGNGARLIRPPSMKLLDHRHQIRSLFYNREPAFIQLAKLMRSMD